MGTFIAKQPNGLYCRFSTVVDCPTDWNMTADDYIEICKQQAEKQARFDLEHYLRPFDQVREYFHPNNMTEEEFNEFLKDVEEDMVEQSPDEPEKDTSNIRDELKRTIYDSMKAFSGADLLLYILSLKHVVDEIYKEVNDALGGDDKDERTIYVNSMVFKSRYTPGLENATDIRLDVGEHVMWRGKSGDTVEIIIDSELMHNSGHLGYESIFTDTNERAFACSDQIIDWEGKV